MVKKQTKNYQTPTVKVVQFMVELGYALYGEKNQNNLIPDFESMEASPRNNQYSTANDWGTFAEM
jgi:hypothetical protein